MILKRAQEKQSEPFSQSGTVTVYGENQNSQQNSTLLMQNTQSQAKKDLTLVKVIIYFSI